jgi:hypothetical protein
MKLSGRLETLKPIPSGVERNLTPSLFMYSEAGSPATRKIEICLRILGRLVDSHACFFDRANPPICEAELDFDRSNPKTKT